MTNIESKKKQKRKLKKKKKIHGKNTCLMHT